MNNILTYAQGEFRNFSKLSFNNVDSTIFSWLSYIRWPDAVFEQQKYFYPLSDFYRAEHFDEMFKNIKRKEDTLALLTAIIASPRYRNVRILDYRHDTDTTHEKQFAATTFEVDKDLLYIAFRGTDSTFVGWKEDLNMAFQYPVPSQESAASYLSYVGAKYPGKIIIGGHSKGGNLAIYAAAHNQQLLSRISRIYSLDGPGFLKEVIDSSDFAKISSKIEKIVPQSSIIGMLLEQHEKYSIIKSDEHSFWQHDPFSWEIKDADFIAMPELTRSARSFDTTINKWLLTVTPKEREEFVDAIYEISKDIDANGFLEFGQNMPSNLSSAIQSASGLDEEKKTMILDTIKSLASFSVKSLPEKVIEKIRK